MINDLMVLKGTRSCFGTKNEFSRLHASEYTYLIIILIFDTETAEKNTIKV